MLSMLARAQTLTTLTRLDGVRKRSVVQFLDETDLINKHAPVMLLDGADLQGANLSDTNLLEVRLCLANLREVDLSNAFLGESDLKGCPTARGQPPRSPARRSRSEHIHPHPGDG